MEDASKIGYEEVGLHDIEFSVPIDHAALYRDGSKRPANVLFSHPESGDELLIEAEGNELLFYVRSTPAPTPTPEEIEAIVDRVLEPEGNEAV